MVHIDFTILLNSVGKVGRVGAWFNGWHVSNFDMGRVGRSRRSTKFWHGSKKIGGSKCLCGLNMFVQTFIMII